MNKIIMILLLSFTLVLAACGDGSSSSDTLLSGDQFTGG